MTWRFLREGPRRQTATSSSDGIGGMQRTAGAEGVFGSLQETQFQSILSGYAQGDAEGRRSLADEYRSFERNLQQRMAQEAAREHGEGDTYAAMRQDMKQDPHMVSVLGEASSSSSDDEGAGAKGPEQHGAEDRDHEGNEENMNLLPSVATLQQKQGLSDGYGGERQAAGIFDSEKADGFVKSAPRMINPHDAAAGGQTSTMNYDEDEAYLSNPAMAPCVIWHTPMRVKIAANLPHELRAEVNDDDAFVQQPRLVPDIWDHKFLPVTRRSVAAPLPKDSVKYRGHSYGAWYLPVSSWGRGVEGDKKKGKKKGGASAEEEEEEVPELLDRALREMVKLPSSKMFYQYIKSQKAPNNRVPHYLKKLEEEGL